MIITAFKRLFVEDYPDAPKGNWFPSLISNVNQFFDQVGTALQNQLTFADNFRGEAKTLSKVSSGVEVQIGTRANPIGVLILAPLNGSMVTGFSWRLIKTNVIGVTIQYTAARSNSGQFSIFILE